TEQLLQQFPDDANLQMARLSYLRGFDRRDERLALLHEICEGKDSDPLFWQRYAYELSDDAREIATALRWARRALRARPLEAENFALLANLLWAQQERQEALALYRFAACLSDKDEQLSTAYFTAARHFKQTPTVLQFLESRFKRFGSRSSQPARTLFGALNQVNQTSRAFEVLEEAMTRRPEDGSLLLFAAQAYGRYGQFDRAAAVLETARPQTARTAWLRAAAILAAHRGELKAALELWQEVLQAEPLAIDAHEQVARLLAETESPEAALSHFRQATERFPHHYALHQSWVEWLRAHEPEAAEGALRRLVEIDSTDAWARRELALALAEQRRFEEAFAEVEIATHLSPHDSYNYSVRGEICSLTGQWEEAKAAFRQAIHLAIDNGYAITRLIDACDSLAEKREAIAFVESELVRQTIFGDGLLAFREQAQTVLDPEELLIALRKALDARPDLWHAWSATIRQLIDLDRLDEALDLARQSTERFPLLPVVWVDLAAVHQARVEREGQKAALQQALQINPGYSFAVRQLASVYEAAGQYGESKTLLEKAVTRDPLNVYNHAWLADALWQTGDKDAAVASLKKALQLEPGLMWAWEKLGAWAQEIGQPQEAVELARDLVRRRSGEARSWMILARILAAPDDLEERLAALDQAMTLTPRLFEARDLKAELLTEAGRFEEAIAACHPATGEHIPS
ncbi:MAG: tetratricopeptide repeat protein, partial [Armatimonadota bacterium]|nr:tetratricopeptide repeat protein [Armatimonadota bacterium]